jgi:hypothetical protein
MAPRAREIWRRYFADLNELLDILARYPEFVELIPPPDREKFELPSLHGEFPEMEEWLSFEGREILKRRRKLQSGIISLAETPSPSLEKVKTLIYRVIYFSPPQPDPALVRKDKEAIGVLYFRPHLFDFDIPIFKIEVMGKIVRFCPTAEWWEGGRILPVLSRWAPKQEMDFEEWRVWADFLLKRLEKETDVSIPAKGYWEIKKEKIEEKETPPPPESEWTEWYDGLNELSLEERERYEKEARAEEERRVKEMRHKPPKIFRKKVYIEGWDDILTECMDLGLAKVKTEEDIEKIIEEAKRRWQDYSL